MSFRQKITFDLSRLDDEGLYGTADAKRALSYEFCIPNTAQNRTEVESLDPTVKFYTESPGRIGCEKHESLCIGSTHQKDFINGFAAFGRVALRSTHRSKLFE